MVVVVVVVDDNDARCDTVFDRVGSPDFEATDAAKWLVHRKQPAWKQGEDRRRGVAAVPADSVAYFMVHRNVMYASHGKS